MRSRPSDLYEHVSVFDGGWRSSPGRFVGRSFHVRGYGRRGPCIQLGRAWTQRPRLCTSVRVPRTDILDSSPQVSIQALALEWRLFLVVEFPWGRASDPAGVAPEPLEEFLTPSRVIFPNLRKHSRCPSLRRAESRDWFISHRGYDVLPVERASCTPD